MLSTLHILLTYKCPLRCDHCYVFGSPANEGSITSSQLNQLLTQAIQINTIEWIIFEGGEPFLYYPLLLKSVQKARKLGFKVGVFTNGFFARTEAAAVRYLLPLARLHLDTIYISNDRFHYNTRGETPATRAGQTAMALGIPVVWKSLHLQIDENFLSSQKNGSATWDDQRFLMVGRAVDKLTSRFPPLETDTFTSCPSKNLCNLEHLSIDATGNVQICPGIAIGKVWSSPLDEIIEKFSPYEHPICAPLISGGPRELSAMYSCQPEGQFVDACHFCYATRSLLIDKYPEFLAPKQVYGIH